MFAQRFAGMTLAHRRLRLPVALSRVTLLTTLLVLLPGITGMEAAKAAQASAPKTAQEAAHEAAQEPAQAPTPPLELKFAQFFRQPVGDHGLALSEALLAANGREVRLVGYMVAQELPKAGRFWLTPRPVRMSEHADGEADDLPPATVTVQLDPAQQDRLVAHRDGLLVLTGRLRVGRFEDDTGRVSWIRLELPPQALEAQPGTTSPSPSVTPHP
ncbi:hypothetical protein SAMN05216359_102659 [Roseateles sp. YR242]|uniref:hypothetical protein n=1 Tax=Roseateles sp. YR242 TaxID=1855305 RepID=UPI0008B537B8|nr:hypothetical protein [Roseateles sp. YR242]SEK68222.1 hypothetical protein SAMN05216359_102659 [Roseateles sp. YR242]